jgi:ERCC4-type nuclease
VHHNQATVDEKLSLTQIETKKKKKGVIKFTDYLLDFIVERKTADDLAASIMDGRYEE